MDTNLKQFATRNDTPHHIRQTMITLLNQQLANTFDLYSQVKQAHWNVKGIHFIQLIHTMIPGLFSLVRWAISLTIHTPGGKLVKQP